MIRPGLCALSALIISQGFTHVTTRLAPVDRETGTDTPLGTTGPSSTTAPMSMQMPKPALGSYVSSPTIEGAAPFHAGFDVNKGLQAAWGTGAIPGPYAADEGAFRFVCGGGGLLKYDDPVIYPGQPGKSHLHYPWGNMAFDADTTPASLAASATTTCNDTPFALNRSSYWMPAVIDDQGRVRLADAIEVYYKRARSDSGYCKRGLNPAKYQGTCVTLPNQIRFVFGWNPFDPAAKVEGASWYCTNGDGRHHSNLDDLFAAGCAVGSQIVADTVAPSCWDGKNLDTPNHRKHVAYMMYDGTRAEAVCPKGYAYIIPQEENKAFFTVTADMIGKRADGTLYSRIRLSSDAMLPGAKPGQTLHADYMEMWDASAKSIWLANCIEKGLSCSGGDLGNGQQLIGAARPAYGWINPDTIKTMPNPGVAKF